MSVKNLKAELHSYASPERKKTNEWFFKTGEGEYGFGDKFIGISMTHTRKVARHYHNLKLSDLHKLLTSPIHEERMTALLILVAKFEKAGEELQTDIFEFYLENDKHINNWDLVDTSAPKIIGAYVFKHPSKKSILIRYSKSKNLWQRRIAIIATFAFIRDNQFDLTMKIAKTLLLDSHDLTHKAVGWMLREVWKRDHRLVEKFLIDNYNKVPRTTLRYAIERMVEFKRKQFLNKTLDL
ncbi:DNA alkylation repair protein [Candidatus Parcubacteria bacterium]|uniref:DNA alkylation repair protein n=1 Tax=Candidatus Uhrbacteria bacterium CG_4_9_14_3_um_filter_41_35 TaxID=1975034 RepID=A0A2M7XEG2_9BACT|nr:DNA alkylation repair protein [Candidatus Parcubacteria bacterium]PIQ67505.1 MAG: DNA alkylation repair protein [Candidatus Uhrbacteria bacterium CG11_big_fil_rev_8_21_14_0_20_41_9]PJA46254.1 MAG: DNA alkylation repair protein [Candidatus Uhrbacteria bacterium CG_4_9_14_3_um_filter_41_35]